MSVPSKIKTIPSDKPRVIPLDHIPENLGGNFYAFERVKLVNEADGKFAVRFKNTGTILVSSVHERDYTTFKNTSQITHWDVYYPIILSAHENDNLQVINVETGVCELFPAEKDTVKKAQAFLVSDERIYCVFVNGILMWQRQNMKQPPHKMPLQDVRDDKVRPVINVKHQFCKLINNNQLLLANADVFQIWNVTPQNELYVEFEGRNANQQVKYFGVKYSDDAVVTNNRENFMLWDTKQPKEAGKNPKELQQAGFISSVYMDDTFIIMGDGNGLVTLRSKKDGKKLYDLNVVNVEALPKVQEGSLLEYNFDNKVNNIEKVGRYVICAFENARLAVYDITKEAADPIFEYLNPKGGTIPAVLVGKEAVVFALKRKTSDKDKGVNDKPDIAIWAPPFAGYQFFFEKGASALNLSSTHIQNGRRNSLGNILTRNNVNTLTLLLAFSYSQISGALEGISKAGEDVTEFTSIIGRVEDVIKSLVDNPDYNISFMTLKNLQLSMDDYANMLEKLTSSGRLMRFFTSNRLRRNIEVQNSALHRKLNEIEDIIKVCAYEKKKRQPQPQQPQRQPEFTPAAGTAPPTKHAQPLAKLHHRTSDRNLNNNQAEYEDARSRQTDYEDLRTKSVMNLLANRQDGETDQGQSGVAPPATHALDTININDVEGKKFWAKYFPEELMVEWSTLMHNMREYLPGQKIGQQEETSLKDILDHGDTGYVSLYKFSEFLKGFGPFERCVDNVTKILSEPWFHRWLSSREAELLMKTSFEVDGTFLVRFSKSKPGSFALAFVRANAVRHILIESNMPYGFRISEQETSGATRVFMSLHEIVDHYKFVLKFPYTDTLSQRPWFHGDLSTEEANELLLDQPHGTYIIRFSSRGCFAASFVDNRGCIKHVLINANSKNNFEVNTGEGQKMYFFDIPELVQFYHEKGVFMVPLTTSNR